MDKTDLHDRFRHYAPKTGQQDVYEDIRSKTKSLAFVLDGHCQDSRELSIAIEKLEECVFWANAAIARHSA